MFEKKPLQNFSGRVPLFPLPNVVLFPQTLLPLHIFEKRYRILLRDALRGEKLIGMSVLKPGWEEKYEGNPEIYPVACVGTIIKRESLANGRSNIFLLGLKRVRIKEIVNPRPYRTAAVELLHDSMEGLATDEAEHYRSTLLDLYGEFVIEFAGSQRKYPPLSDSGMNLATLTDVLAAGIGLPVAEMVYLLGETRVMQRAQYMLERMGEMLRKGGPPLQPGEGLPAPFGSIHLN